MKLAMDLMVLDRLRFWYFLMFCDEQRQCSHRSKFELGATHMTLRCVWRQVFEYVNLIKVLF